MSKLFVDLYRYRQRERKHNLEDWLTECVAAIFRSFDPPQWTTFLSDLLGEDADALATLLNGRLPDVQTQVPAGAEYGIPDLVLYIHGRPWLLIEGKVAHSVAEAVSEEGAVRNQLHRYADWLALNADPGSRPHLAFLTHITRPPDDFSNDDANLYCGVARLVTTWGALGRLLKTTTNREGKRSLSHSLTCAFYTMLEDKNMANEFPGSTAMASLELFLTQGRELENLLDRMWSEVAFVAKCSNQSAKRIESEFKYGRYTAWRYTNRIDRVDTTNAFLMTGIWFPEVVKTWEASELNGYAPWGPQIFLYFADDDEEVFSDIPGQPAVGWFRPSGDILRLRPLHEFQGDPDNRATEIMKWLAGEAKVLREFLLGEKLTG